MALTVAELLKEKERWEKVLEDAKIARGKIAKINRIIVMLADVQELEDFDLAGYRGNGGLTEGRTQNRMMAVLDAMYREPDAVWTAKEVVENIDRERFQIPNWTPQDAHSVLFRLKSTGKIRKLGRGSYKMTAKGRKEVEGLSGEE